jgi:acyl dehydratase
MTFQPKAGVDFIYLEDLKVGQKFAAGPRIVTEEEIIAYARQFDPQDFHTSPILAKDTVFGGLVASGWHTASMTMRLILEATPKMKGGMIGRQVEKISWPRPVRPGDELSLEIEIIDIRPSATNPARGTARTRNTVSNQKGETVMEMDTVILVPRREAGV